MKKKYLIILALLFSSATFASEESEKSAILLQEPVPPQIFPDMQRTVDDANRYDEEMETYKEELAKRRAKK